QRPELHFTRKACLVEDGFRHFFLNDCYIILGEETLTSKPLIVFMQHYNKLNFLKISYILKSCMVLLALNCFTLAICKSQTVNNRSVLNLNYLQYSSEIPKEILSEKTTVFVADLLPASNGKSSWQSFAKEVHKTFYRLGIDA